MDLVLIDDDDCERSDTAPPAFKVDTPLAANLEASTSAEHTRRLAEDSEMAKRLVTALGFKADS